MSTSRILVRNAAPRDAVVIPEAAAVALASMAIRHRAERFIVIVAVLLATLFHSSASGQVISVEYDLNTPAYPEPEGLYEPGLDVDRGFSLRVGLLLKSYESRYVNRRWSVFVGHQSLETTPRTADPYPTKHSAKSIEVGHDWLVFRRERVRVSLGVSLGLVIVSSRNRYSGSCDTAFCNLADGGWTASGYGNLELPVSPKFGMVIGVRSWLLDRGRDDMYPFERGPVVSVGMRLS